MRTLYNKSKALFLGVALTCSFGAQAQSGGIPVNDLCVNATPIACGGTASGSTVGATVDNAGTCGTSNTAPGVWYTFAGDGSTVTAGLCSNTTYDSKLSVYTGSCGSFVCVNGADDVCGDDGQVTFNSVSGTTYYILVHGFSSGTGAYTLSLTCVAPPANDLCANAIEVFCNDAISGSTVGATTTGGTAGIGSGVWYKYTGNDQLVTVGTCTSTSGFDTEIAVFAGDCNNRIDVGSDDDGCSPYSELSFEAWAGLDYYIYVGHWSPTAGTTGNFDLTVSCAALPAPPNDLCADATPLVCGDSFIGNTSSGNATGQLSCANGAPGVWYSFVGDGSDYTISLDGSSYDTYLGISTTCGGTCVASNDDIDFSGGNYSSEISGFTTVNAQTYYVYISGFSGSGLPGGDAGTYLLNLTSSICAPPLNDLCANAEVIECGDVVSGNTELAAAETGLGTCGTSLGTAPGVWYTYVGTGEDVTVSTCSANTTFDTKLGVFSGDCNALVCVGGNDDDSNCSSSGTRSTYSFYGQAGVAYYIYVTAFSTNTGDFDLSITCNCTAAAGTLTADANPVCLDGGSADISATVATAPVVPVGYTVGYVLTSNPGLIIEQVAATPDFTVTEGGDYIIHTLVYNPATLDLSGVVLGTTSALDVLPSLVQGGGSICANLDAAGAPVTVEAPDAGTLTADASPVCLDAGSADISATENAAPVVPAGYSVLYVLTSNPGLIIEQVAATPDFTVTEGGDYIIHTLVYNPITLDLSGVVLGTTSALDVLPSITQGGGSICANLDAAGAPITVEAPDAGTLTADASPVCLDAGSADISATENAAPVVPAGYSVLYVLTSNPGLIVEQVAATPDFTVTAEGDYIIHTLVYNPATLDLSGVVLGTTSALDVLPSLVQGGGSICANLDAAGAPITVELCGPANDDCAGAVVLTQGATCVPTQGTLDGATESLPGCSALNEANDVWFVFTATAESAVVDVVGSQDVDAVFEFYEAADCGSLPANGICVDNGFSAGDPESEQFDNLTIGNTYYVRVHHWNGGAPTDPTFDICVYDAPPPPPVPANDLCANAQAIACGDVVAGTNVGATEQDVTTYNAGTVGAGVWYTFTGTGGDVTLSTCDDADFDTEINVITTADCVDYTNNVAGNDDGTGCGGFTSEVTFTTTIGQTYYVYVSDYASGGSEFGTFNLTLTCDPVTGINEVANADINVYPNPSNGQFVVEVNGVEADAQLTVMDVTGRQVYTEGVTMNGSFRKELNLNVAKGTYLLQVATVEGVVTRKIQIH